VVKSESSFQFIFVEPLFPDSLDKFCLLGITFEDVDVVPDALKLADEYVPFWTFVMWVSLRAYLER